MKKVRDYAVEWSLNNDNDEINKQDFIAAVKQIQEEAIRETVKECAENVLILLEPLNGKPYTDKSIFTYATLISPDKNSILSIADKLIREL